MREESLQLGETNGPGQLQVEAGLADALLVLLLETAR